MSEVRRVAIVIIAMMAALAAGLSPRLGLARSNGQAGAQDQPEPKAKPRSADPFGSPPGTDPVVEPEPRVQPDRKPGDLRLPKVDSEVVPAQAPAGDTSGFYFPKPETLPEGSHAVGLTVDVQAPKAINLNKSATLWIIVKNSGTTDALGVVVREKLPDGLDFVEATPAPTDKDPCLSWNLRTVPAGKEQRIKLLVKATKKVGNIDHAPTVTMMTGGRARMTIREPKLRVEQRASASQALKGEPIRFDITVTNTGDGPARNVTVTAKLGPGLRFENGTQVVLKLADLEPSKPVLQPGESVTLDPLMVEAVADGENACQVVAESDDVAAGAPEAQAQDVVKVVAPKLNLLIKGPAKRYTEMTAEYHVIVENTGSAIAKNVRVAAYVEKGARLVEKPEGATWKSDGHYLRWDLGDIEPKKPVDLSYTVRLEGVQRYSFRAATTADTLAREEKGYVTDVTGIADVTVKVSEVKRVIDLGESTVFTVKVVNKGTTEAKHLLITAQLSEHLDPESSSGTDQPADANHSTHLVRFPMIDSLPAGGQMTLSIQAKALRAGYAKCIVEIRHDDLGPDGKEEDSESVRVSEAATATP